MRLTCAVLVATTVVVVLGACSSPAGSGPSQTPEVPSPYLTVAIGEFGPGTPPAGDGIYPFEPATHAHVQLSCPLVPAVHYDPEAIPASSVDRIYICTIAPYTDAPDGTGQIQEFVDRVDDDDIGRLLEAYAVPDEEPTDGACTYEATDPAIIWLHHGGTITPVYAPFDECHHTMTSAREAYDSVELHRVLVAREKLRS
jgi:hypothetical protein